VPEAVFLGPDWFGYYPDSESHHASRAVDPDKIITLSFQQLESFILLPGKNGRGLNFTSSTVRHEVGSCLIEAERAWLFELLQQWRQGIDVQRARDTRIIDAEMASWKERWSDPWQTGIVDKGGS
jgi:hypothetical protein